MITDNKYNYYVKTYKAYSINKKNNLSLIDKMLHLDALDYRVLDKNSNLSDVFILFDSVNHIKVIDNNIDNKTGYIFGILKPDIFTTNDFAHIIKKTINTKLIITDVVYDNKDIIDNSDKIEMRFDNKAKKDYKKEVNRLLDSISSSLKDIVSGDNNKSNISLINRLIEKIMYLSDEMKLDVSYVDIKGSNYLLRVYNSKLIKVSKSYKITEKEKEHLFELVMHLCS